jgi:Xaa-Pro aminopeptidase
VTSPPPLLEHPYSRRIAAVRGALGSAAIDGLLVTHPPNLRDLTGFDGSLGALLVSGSRCTLIVDGRYVTAARARAEVVPELRDVGVELAERSLEETIARVVLDARVEVLGIEAAATTLSRFNKLADAFAGAGAQPSLQPVERIVEVARLIKDAVELAALRRGAAMLSDVAREVPSFVKAGRTERQVAGRIDSALREAGFERLAFETIVASGPNSALPHARPSLRTLTPGDGVVLDFGGVYDGYCVDLTRTVQLSPQTDAFGRLFDAVAAAHAAAIKAVRPGIAASAVDAAARESLAAAGLADAFMHGTGHGLGLEVHEEPRISRAGGHAEETLRPGMVFTVEPGAYVAGLGGVRIEDDVVVVEEGCEILTDVPIDQRLGSFPRSDAPGLAPRI